MMAGMSFQLWPINLSIIQLFIVGIGVASAVGVFNGFNKSGAKAVGALVAIIIFLVAIFIAFFKMSELGLLAFVAKMIRNNFFDTTRKYQVNYEKQNHLDVLIKEAKSVDQKQTVFERKDSEFSKEKVEKIDKSGLI